MERGLQNSVFSFNNHLCFHNREYDNNNNILKDNVCKKDIFFDNDESYTNEGLYEDTLFFGDSSEEVEDYREANMNLNLSNPLKSNRSKYIGEYIHNKSSNHVVTFCREESAGVSEIIPNLNFRKKMKNEQIQKNLANIKLTNNKEKIKNNMDILKNVCKKNKKLFFFSCFSSECGAEEHNKNSIKKIGATYAKSSIQLGNGTKTEKEKGEERKKSETERKGINTEQDEGTEKVQCDKTSSRDNDNNNNEVNKTNLEKKSNENNKRGKCNNSKKNNNDGLDSTKTGKIEKIEKIEKIKNVDMDDFCYRQFDNSYKFCTHIPFDRNLFVSKINEIIKSGNYKLMNGYASFCKHLFIENFTEVTADTVPLEEKIIPLVRSHYFARNDKELPVLIRWIPKKYMPYLEKAKYLDIILYTKEQIQKENEAMNVLKEETNNVDENAEEKKGKEKEAEGVEYSIIAVKAQNEPYELPMSPITMMRNTCIEEGGSGVKIDREAYAKSVIYWSKNISVYDIDTDCEVDNMCFTESEEIGDTVNLIDKKINKGKKASATKKNENDTKLKKNKKGNNKETVDKIKKV